MCIIRTHCHHLYSYETNKDGAVIDRVLVDADGRGYVTGLILLGHAMATSEEAWVAVMSRAIEARKGAVACITILGVQYPRLINWALAARLQLARYMPGLCRLFPFLQVECFLLCISFF